MSIWAIADIHSSRLDPATGLPSKPMDLFGAQWEEHVARLERAWDELVDTDDTVIIAGDIDWALHLEDALETLGRIDRWKGRKILIRGNHDYWWSSKSTSRVRRALPPSLHALHNDAVQVEGFNICGAKGSPVPGAIDWSDQQEKLLNREVGRLVSSLAQRDSTAPTIVALHFPPFYPPGGSPYREIIDKEKVSLVVYGHLHGEAAAFGPSGRYGDTEYCLVAGDAVGFRPALIAGNGLSARE